MADLKDVKVGDVLAYRGTWGDVGLTKVEKVTKTLIVCGIGRFNRERGWAAGTSSSYSRSRIWIPSDDDRLKVRMSQAQRGLEKFKVNEENLVAVEALLVPVKPARGN